MFGHSQVKLGIHLRPSLLPALVCCHTQDKRRGRAGRKGSGAGEGKESQNILSPELPHALFRLSQWASPSSLSLLSPIPTSQPHKVHQPLVLGWGGAAAWNLAHLLSPNHSQHSAKGV